MTVKIFKAGQNSEGLTNEALIRLLAQQEANRRTAALSDITNNSGGTAGTVTAVTTTLANVAASGSSLAGGATTLSAYNTVLDAISELCAAANAAAAVLNITQITDSSGATTPDGTVGAVTVSVTGAATGALAANITTAHTYLNNAQYQVSRLINTIAESVGVAGVAIDYAGTDSNTLAAITIATGTAADPGLTKVAVDSYLATYRDNVKTMAAALLRITAADTLKVRAQ